MKACLVTASNCLFRMQCVVTCDIIPEHTWTKARWGFPVTDSGSVQQNCSWIQSCSLIHFFCLTSWELFHFLNLWRKVQVLLHFQPERFEEKKTTKTFILSRTQTSKDVCGVTPAEESPSSTHHNGDSKGCWEANVENVMMWTNLSSSSSSGWGPTLKH